MIHVLFVCLGNICRSPAAEVVFRDMAGQVGLDVEADSAGTAGWHVGKPPYEPMIRAAAARGYDLRPLRARRFVAEDFSRFDLLLAMDGDNLRDMEILRPPGNDTPAELFLSCMSNAPFSDVPDPYYTRDFEQTLDLIEQASRDLIERFR